MNETFEEWYAEQDVYGLGYFYKELAQLAWDAGFEMGRATATEARVGEPE